MIAVATVRHFRTVAKTETVWVRRYYREWCHPFCTPTSRGVSAIGVPRWHRDASEAHTHGLSCAQMCEPVVPQGLRALFPSNAPQRAGFWRIETPAKRTRMVCLARGNPRPRKYPREYPRPRKYPPEYPRSGLAKSPAISRTYEKYPQYPQYPRDVGDADGRAYIRIHKETLNFTLLIYI